MVKEILREKISRYLTYLMQFLLFVVVVVGLYRENYVYAINGILFLILTFIPFLLRQKWKIRLPWGLVALLVIFLYLHIAGGIYEWYFTYYPFYDKGVHFLGCLALAFLSFTSAIIINKYTNLKLNKVYVILLAISITMLLGVFWEIAQFTFDEIANTTTQTGLEDTMYDLILDFVGSLVVVIIGSTRYNSLRKQILGE